MRMWISVFHWCTEICWRTWCIFLWAPTYAPTGRSTTGIDNKIMVLPGSSRQYHQLPPHLPSTPFPSWKPIHSVRVVLFATIMWSTLMLPRPMQNGSTVATVTPLMHDTSIHTSTYTMEHVPSAAGISHPPTHYVHHLASRDPCLLDFHNEVDAPSLSPLAHTQCAHLVGRKNILCARRGASNSLCIRRHPFTMLRSFHPWIRRKTPHKQVL